MKTEGLQVVEKMEREMGFEPTASSLGNCLSIEKQALRRRRRRFLAN